MGPQELSAAAPRFYLISDRRRMGSDPFAPVMRMARLGLPAFQWREKDLSALANYDLLCRAATFWKGSAVTTHLLVNDRVDIAAALSIGVHLPEEGLPIRTARSLLPGGGWIARSTHSVDMVLRAQEAGADFVTFGPIFETESKKSYGPPQGLDALRAVTATAGSFPVVAVGGITMERAVACIEAGAAGVAVIGAIWDAPDPVAAYEGFARVLGIGAES